MASQFRLVLLPRRLQDLLDPLRNRVLLILRGVLRFVQPGDFVVDLFKLVLGLQEPLLAEQQRFLVGGRALAPFKIKLVQLDHLIHQRAGVVHPFLERRLPLASAGDLAVDPLQLLAQRGLPLGQIRGRGGVHQGVVVGGIQVADVVEHEAQQPDEEKRKQDGEEHDAGAQGERDAARANGRTG
ncbi:MAG: hypothetical protein BWZ08_00326 [candidate division BRC1 bacterium ADurb.BinA292]|nr:MAG: hypothetical protein BWZ08_00326 [candidate division BRC1 bacterium ADurb.BinA292]